MGKRRGRPKKIDSRTEQYRLRMNKEEIFWLNQLCKNEGLTKADALRTLIKMGYDMSKNGAFNGYPKNTYKIMKNWINRAFLVYFGAKLN